MFLTSLYDFCNEMDLLKDESVVKFRARVGIRIDSSGNMVSIEDFGKKTNRIILSPRPLRQMNYTGCFNSINDIGRRIIKFPTTEKNENKQESSYKASDNFWENIDKIAEESKLPSLMALSSFGKLLITDGKTKEKIIKFFNEHRLVEGVSIAFFLHDSNSAITEEPAFRDWWCKKYFDEKNKIEMDEEDKETPKKKKKKKTKNMAFCRITGEEEEIPESLPEKITINVQVKEENKITEQKGYIHSGACMISKNNECYEVDGFEGTTFSSISKKAYIKISTAINYLADKENKHCVIAGDQVLLMWSSVKNENSTAKNILKLSFGENVNVGKDKVLDEIKSNLYGNLSVDNTLSKNLSK